MVRSNHTKLYGSKNKGKWKKGKRYWFVYVYVLT